MELDVRVVDVVAVLVLVLVGVVIEHSANTPPS